MKVVVSEKEVKVEIKLGGFSTLPSDTLLPPDLQSLRTPQHSLHSTSTHHGTSRLPSKKLPNPGPPPPKKKRKKNKDKDSSTTSGLTITSDDLDLRDTSTAGANSDDDGPLISNLGTAEFRKSKKSNWQTIGAPAPKDADQAQADAIIAAAAREDLERRAADDAEDAPAILEDDNEEGVRMESGARAGLQTAAQTEAMVRAQREKRRKDEEMGLAPVSEGGVKGKEETIYRDASGRIINVAMKRAEARKKAEEERAKEEAEKEAQKGDVQRKQREERKQQLQDAKYMTLSRYKDDVEMNDELREQERWNDPAAQFLTKKKEGKSRSGMPLYNGPAAPNRYGIRPGHRWDGVDRGNGFEKEWFAARNKVQRRGELEYMWQMDE